MTKFQNLINRKRAEYGGQFDTSELNPDFIDLYNSGQRVEVEQYGEKHQGYIGITTGWRPIFLLIFNRRALGSSNTIGPDAKVTRTFNTYR